MLTIFVATLLGVEDKIGLGTVLGTISNATSYPSKPENDLQEEQNNSAGTFLTFLIFNNLS